MVFETLEAYGSGRPHGLRTPEFDLVPETLRECGCFKGGSYYAIMVRAVMDKIPARLHSEALKAYVREHAENRLTLA